MKQTLSEPELTFLLRERFPPPEYAFIPQVRNGTGFRYVTRTADALVMGLYPSRGLHLHGFEIKSDRRDWIREKKDPDKAEEIARFCDFWWIVAGNEDVVAVDELPKNWGLMVPTKGGKALLMVERPALLERKEISRAFLAAILRRAQEAVVPKDGIEELLREKHREGREAGRKAALQERDWELRRLRDLEKKVLEFQEASGVLIENAWDLGDVGEIIRRLRSVSIGEIENTLRRQAERARGFAQGIEELLAQRAGEERKTA